MQPKSTKYAMFTGESWLIASLLSISGGLQDAYSFIMRDGVFANAQTGNIVLLSRDLFSCNFHSAVRYFIPLCAFICGIFASEVIRYFFGRSAKHLTWQQTVLGIESVLLFCVGCIGVEYNHMANAVISFSCAMQVQSFRNVNGKSFASTMCIGNLRSFTEHLFSAVIKRSRHELNHALGLFLIIILFAGGAGMGYFLSKYTGFHSIWASSLILFLSAILMYLRTKKPIPATLNQ